MKPPKHLGRTAAAAWRRIVAECELAGIATEGKYDVLERYAVTYEMWLTCQAAIVSEGQLLADGSRNPRMVDLHKLTSAVRSIRCELGLGPVTQRVGARRRAADKSAATGDAESTEPTEAIRTGRPRVVYKFDRFKR